MSKWSANPRGRWAHPDRVDLLVALVLDPGLDQAFVERDLRAHLDCGIVARGLARVRRPDCGFERLAAFSCKSSVCPSHRVPRAELRPRILGLHLAPGVAHRQPSPGCLK
jgi:hypothetical protein